MKQRSLADISLAVAAVLVLIGALCAGCGKSDSDTASATGGAPQGTTPAAPAAQASQAVQAVQNNPQLSAPLKAQLTQQMQRPDGRPPGAPAAPMAKP